MQKPYNSYNPYFFIPFAIWVLLGGIAQLVYGRQVLFAIVNTHYNPLIDIVMYYISMLGEGIVGSIVLFGLLFIKSFRNRWYLSVAILSNALPPFIIQVIKHSVKAPRPLNYFQQAQWIHFVPEWPRLMNNSFPSGHTCAAFCFFALLAILLKPAYKWIGIFFLILALLVGYSRLYLAAHFFIDVYAGSIIGTSFTMLVIFLLNRYERYFFKRTV